MITNNIAYNDEIRQIYLNYPKHMDIWSYGDKFLGTKAK